MGSRFSLRRCSIEARLKGATLLSNYRIKVYKINFSYDDIHIRPFSDGSDDDASVAASNTDESAVYLRYVVGRNK
jgi:hypothetical protein